MGKEICPANTVANNSTLCKLYIEFSLYYSCSSIEDADSLRFGPCSHELNVHYDWHWDIQIDYGIETALKSLETDRDTENNVKIGNEQTHMLSCPPSISPLGSKVRHDGEVVALSFVGGSDLKAGTSFASR
jgi:hypothetical protein